MVFIREPAHLVLVTVKINSESCTIMEDVIDEDQEVLKVWLIHLILLFYCCSVFLTFLNTLLLI